MTCQKLKQGRLSCWARQNQWRQYRLRQRSWTLKWQRQSWPQTSLRSEAAVLSENLDAFLSDFGVTVIKGAVSTTGVLDMPSEVIAGGMVITTDYALTIKTSALPSLQYGDALTVDGSAYTVRESKLQDDGQFSIVYLSKV